MHSELGKLVEGARDPESFLNFLFGFDKKIATEAARGKSFNRGS